MADDGRVAATMFGQTVSFTPGGKTDDLTGFIGIRAMPNLGHGISAFVDGEVHMGNDGFARSEARARLIVRF